MEKFREGMVDNVTTYTVCSEEHPETHHLVIVLMY